IKTFIEKCFSNQDKALKEATSESLQKYIAENATIEQFMQIAEGDHRIALVLARSSIIRKFIAEKATVDDFIAIIKKDRFLGLFLAGDQEICKLVYEPEKIKMIMQIDKQIANHKKQPGFAGNYCHS